MNNEDDNKIYDIEADRGPSAPVRWGWITRCQGKKRALEIVEELLRNTPPFRREELRIVHRENVEYV